MIGILINNNGKTLFTALPKETEKLEKQLSGIGLNVPMQAVNLSNHNDIGYEIEIYAQSQIDMEIASRIILHDNIGQLNDLMLYISKGDADKMYDRICESHAETISDLYNELTTPPEIETTDKLVIRTTLNYNANFYEPADCIVEKAIAMYCRKRQMSLTRLEQQVLVYMMTIPDKAFSRDELLENIWGYTNAVESRVVDEMLRRVRKKLSIAESSVTIGTVWGYGYQLKLEGAE